MTQTLIDTLRFADRLKDAGFAGEQAEALARALGDELTEQLPSKADFRELKTEFEKLEKKFEGLERKFEGLEEKFEGLKEKFEGLEEKFDLKINALDVKINALRYNLNVILVLVGLIAAVGLIEPISKLFGP